VTRLCGGRTRPARELVADLLESREERLRLTRGRARIPPGDSDDLAAHWRGVHHLDLGQDAGLELVRDGGLRQERDAEALLDHLLCGVDIVELHAAGRRHARGDEERAREVVVAGGPVELDELLLRQVFHSDATLACERMAGLDDEDQPVFVERRAHDVGVLKGAHETERHLLPQYEVEDLLRVAGAHADQNAREAFREALQERGEDVGRHRGRGSDREPAGAAALESVDLHAAIGEGLERANRVGEEGVARIREPHAPRAADEELCAEVGLEPLEPRRERGLGDEERLCRPADALPPRRLHESCDLVEEHP